MRWFLIACLSFTTFFVEADTEHPRECDLGLRALNAGYTDLALRLWERVATTAGFHEYSVAVEYCLTVAKVASNETEVADWLRANADNGVISAKKHLALVYLRFQDFGLGSKAEAFSLAKSASFDGDLDSRAMLGFFYLNGTGVVKNKELGKQYIQQAAEMGSAAARQILIWSYAKGELGFPKDEELSKFWQEVVTVPP